MAKTFKIRQCVILYQKNNWKALCRLAATTYAKHTCLHPTPSGQERHKNSTAKKLRILAATSDSSARPSSRGQTQASETAEAWPLVFRVLHAAKTAKESWRKCEGAEDSPDRVTQCHKEQGSGQQPSNMEAGRPPSRSDLRSQQARQWPATMMGNSVPPQPHVHPRHAS